MSNRITEEWKMMNQTTNLFITGQKGIGKSYLIKKIIEVSGFHVSGFFTLPKFDGENRLGFYFHSLVPVQNNNGMISREQDGKNEPIPNTFDTLGVECLRQSQYIECDCIVMDEIGRFEQNAYRYQNELNKILDSPCLVLGVLKKETIPFLEQIKQRQDTIVFDLEEQTQSDCYDNIINIIDRCLKNRSSNIKKEE